MRILHFVHNFPPEFRGGTELYVMNLSQRQARAGNKIRVVAGSAKEHEGDDQKFELAGRVRVTRIFKRPEEYAHPIDPYTARLSNDFRKLILDFHPDIVHVHHWHMLTIDLVRMARDLGIPVVLTLHDFYPVCSRFFRIRPGNSDVCPPSQSPGECYNCIRKELNPWPAELVDALYKRRLSLGDEIAAASFIYTFSNTVAAFYREISYLPSFDIDVMPIGLLRPLIKTKPKETCHPLKIVTWGGHAEVKGTHILLEAASRRDIRDSVEIHILGKIVNPAYKDRLENLASNCAASFHGYFPESEKPLIGSKYDLAVFPTQAFETYSIVVDEALSMGMPVIATKPGAQGERLGNGGIVVPTGDVDALADGISRFLDNSFRLRTAHEAASIEVGTMDQHWSKLRTVYNRLIDDKRRKRIKVIR